MSSQIAEANRRVLAALGLSGRKIRELDLSLRMNALPMMREFLTVVSDGEASGVMIQTQTVEVELACPAPKAA